MAHRLFRICEQTLHPQKIRCKSSCLTRRRSRVTVTLGEDQGEGLSSIDHRSAALFRYVTFVFSLVTFFRFADRLIVLRPLPLPGKQLVDDGPRHPACCAPSLLVSSPARGH